MNNLIIARTCMIIIWTECRSTFELVANTSIKCALLEGSVKFNLLQMNNCFAHRIMVVKFCYLQGLLCNCGDCYISMENYIIVGFFLRQVIACTCIVTN